MKYFSYNDYLDYNNNEKMHKLLKLEEKKVKYKITQNLTSAIRLESNEEIITKLKNPQTFFNFLNTHFNLQPEFQNKIYKICSNISIPYKTYSENTLIYKLDNNEIYFLIYSISNIDYNISYKMLMLSMEIINQLKKKKTAIKLRNPIIIPIVIYTGTKSWNIQDNHRKLRYSLFNNNRIDLSYNIINITQENNKNCEN